MPQDLLQIGLEHHRGGRLRQAEAAYRSRLSQDPTDLDAAHWLGVLLLQSGQTDEAVLLLERAAADRPSDAAFQHNLAQAYLATRRLDDAISALDRAVALAPDRGETLQAAALARLARKVPDDASAALNLLAKAKSLGLSSAELELHLGIAYLMTGRFDEAIAPCQAAIAKKPDYADAHHHLGVAWRQKGNIDEARRCLNRAFEIDPAFARAIQGLAVLEAEAGRLKESEALFRKAIEHKPNSAAARQGLGMVLAKMGRHNEAALAAIEAVRAAHAPQNTGGASSVEELEQKLMLSPQDAALHFQLAKQTEIAPPAQVPTKSVAGLFDRYADLFDEHLRGKLEYRAPELLADAIRATNPAKPLDILDLGCGTGLCGPLLRPLAAMLAGVDLSPAMIDKARERNVYDRLQAADLLEEMKAHPQAYDLLVAADVLMYLGDLAPVFEAATGGLRPDGLFAFSVEATAADRFAFNRQTHRFAHSEQYIRHLANIFGFEVVSLAPTQVRKEAGKPVDAFCIVLRLVP